MKKEVSIGKAKWIIEPGCVLLVTSGRTGDANVVTISWQTAIRSGDPCELLLVFNPGRYSYELIMRNKQLVINVPGSGLVHQVNGVGTVSGRKIDKFTEFGLTAVPAGKVEPPLIAECAAHLECEVGRVVDLGHHVILVCRVVRAAAEEEYFDGGWNPETFHTIHYLGENTYGLLQRRIEV